MNRAIDPDALPPALERAARLMREAHEPDAAWLRATREAVERARPRQEAQPRVWTMRPAYALAAGLACMLAGAGAAVALRGPTAQPAAADARANVAAPASGVSRVRFALEAPAATTVHIVGDFNGWDPAALPLRRSDDGRTWEVEVPLAPGRYMYSFIVDGALARDPRAARAPDDDFGSPNSVLLVTGS